MQSLAGARGTILPLPCSSCTSCSRPSGFKASFPAGSHNCIKRNSHLRLLLKSRPDNGSQVPWPRESCARASNSDQNLDSPSSNSLTTTSESEKDVLSAKRLDQHLQRKSKRRVRNSTVNGQLAAAEAEAEVLKKELIARRGGSREVDLAKLKISTPEKRIDGTGYREQLFSGPGAKKEPKKWGITEAELFLSKGAPTEGSGLGGEAMEAGADAIIRRRLLIGLGLTAATAALAFIQLPAVFNRPSKPLFFYLVYILRLKAQLETLENDSSDAQAAVKQLKSGIGSREELKDNFLSAAALIDGADVDRASQLAFDIFGYLNQADYSKYFENLGEPTSAQQVEYLKFSLQSIKAARLKIDEYLRLFPAESLLAAKLQLAQ